MRCACLINLSGRRYSGVGVSVVLGLRVQRIAFYILLSNTGYLYFPLKKNETTTGIAVLMAGLALLVLAPLISANDTEQNKPLMGVGDTYCVTSIFL